MIRTIRRIFTVSKTNLLVVCPIMRIINVSHFFILQTMHEAPFSKRNFAICVEVISEMARKVQIAR